MSRKYHLKPELCQILVVDDISANLKLLMEILTKEGYQVRPASNGSLALRSAAAEPPDLILLDVKMPGMDGYEVCRQLKSDGKTVGVPIIFVSALDDVSDKVKGFQAGGVDYLTKPFQAEEVLARVETHLALRQLQKNLEEQNLELNQTLEELKRTQNSLVLQEKMAGIGQLAAGVAHEINNPLGFVISNFGTLNNYVKSLAEIMKAYQNLEGQSFQEQILTIKELEKKKRINFILQDLPEIFSDSEDGLKRVETIVKALRSFSRSNLENQRESYDLNEGVRTTLVVARNEIKYVADVEAELGEIPPVMAISGQINQVLLNILLNAVQAVKAATLEERSVIRVRTFSDHEFVSCSITNNGPLIPNHIKNRIFEPFFTTKPIGEGTGLGLSISYDIIVNRHKGRLFFTSTVEEGTTFTLQLPC